MNSDANIAAAVAPFVIFGTIFMIFATIAFFFKLFLYWKIFSKAGYSGAFALLILAPFGSLIMLCILAFGNWPLTHPVQVPQYPQQPPQQPPQVPPQVQQI